jgi:hypothetical protein
MTDLGPLAGGLAFGVKATPPCGYIKTGYRLRAERQQAEK